MKRARRVLAWALVLTMALADLPAGALAEELHGNVEPEAVVESGLEPEETEDHFPGNKAEEEKGQGETWEAAAEEGVTESVAEEDVETRGASADEASEDDLSASTATSGTCGENVSWQLDDEGTLTISGTGPMQDYSTSNHFYQEISRVVIEEGVTSVGAYAFYCNDNIISVSLPDSLTEVGEYAFEDCTELESITIPDKVTVIGSYAFSSCYDLCYVSLGRSVDTIEPSAFDYCSSLAEVAVNSNISSTGYNNFAGVDRLVIGANVTSLTNLLSLCYRFTDLEEILVDAGNSSFCSENGVLFNKSKTELIRYPRSKTEESYVVPEGVEKIVAEGFSWNDSLRQVSLPNSLIAVERAAFFDCDTLESITIPDNVTVIGGRAFYACTKLCRASLGRSVETVGSYAFDCCSKLAELTISGNISSVEFGAFDSTSIKIIAVGTNVTSMPKQLRTCERLHALEEILVDAGNSSFCSENGVLFNKSKTELIRYPEAKPGDSYAVPEGVEKIADYGFYRNGDLIQVNLPESLTEVGSDAFSNCSSLTTIYYSGGESQWQNISIGTGNDLLQSADITCNYGGIGDDDETGGEELEEEEVKRIIIPATETHYDAGYAGYGQHDYATPSNDTVIRDAYKDLSLAIDEYFKLYNQAVDSLSNQSNAIQTLKTTDKLYGEPLLTKTMTPNEQEAAYAGLAWFFDQLIEDVPSLEKIDLNNSIITIEAKIVKQIRNAYHTYYHDMTYKNQRVTIDAQSMWGKYMVTIKVNNKTAVGVSSVEDVSKTLGLYMIALEETFEDVVYDGLKSYFKVWNNVTGVSDLTEEVFKEAISKTYDAMEQKGYGKISEYAIKMYRTHRKAKSIKNCMSDLSLSNALQDPERLYDEIKDLKLDNDKTIKDYLIDEAYKKVQSKRDDLEQKLYNYIYHPDEALDTKRNWIDNIATFFKHIFQCPVSIRVYNENGEQIGFAEDYYCEYSDDIYMEVDGDVKTVYVPAGMKVRIEMEGVAEGSMNYIAEEFENSAPVGRANFYDIPLQQGSKYVQDSDFDALADITISGNEGSTINASEIIRVDDEAMCGITAKMSDGGEVYGTGKYAKGDPVQLYATPNAGYYFSGWYINGVLVGYDNVYRFTALKDTEVQALFSQNKTLPDITCDYQGPIIMTVGDSNISLNAQTTGDIELKYYSSDDEIVEVSKEGVLTAVNAGEAEIYIVSAESKKYLRNKMILSVTVNDTTPTEPEAPVNLDTPVLVSVTNLTNAVELTWKAVSGAAGYRVYRKTAGGKWARVKDTTDTGFKDTGCVHGTTYYYTVRVLSENGELISGYDTTGLQVRYKCTPVLSKVENVVGGVKVTWKAAGGAARYRLYRKIAGGKWGQVADTTSTTLTDKTAASGTTYIYTVAAYSADGFKSNYNVAGLSILYLKDLKPALTNASTGITVKWSKVTGAKGYYVYRKSGTGSYGKIKTITDGGTVSYTDTAVNAKSGTTYTYAVRAYNGTTAGCYTGASLLRLGTIKPTLANTSTGITVKWAKVTGAKGYYVYRKTGTGSYAKIKTITNGSTVSYTDTASTLVNGTAYTYAVRAYNGTTAGVYTAVGTYRLKGVVISSLTNGATQSMTVKWPADTKVTGYQVQYSTTGDFSSGNQAVTITKNSTVSTTIKSLTKGKTYYVRVRTYKKTAAGTAFYSGWSAKKTVKIAK